MILIEGPDRCGKTTVANLLRDLLPGWSYRHHTRPPVEPYEYFTYFLADTHPRVIVDRNHWSGYAYGQAYLRGKEMTDHQWRYVELAHLSRGTEVLLMMDSVENIRSRWTAEEMYSDNKLEELLGFYNELDTGASDPVSYLPRRRFTLPELVQNDKPTTQLLALIARARDVAERCSRLLPASVGIGHYNPDFVVLGEAPGTKVPPGDRSPGLPLDRGPASEWLWKAFDEIGLEWWKGYYTNASAFAGPEDFATYINGSLGSPRRILCLGNRARHLCHQVEERELFAEETVVGMVEHPSYIRRFKHSQLIRWTGDIREVMGTYCGANVSG